MMNVSIDSIVKLKMLKKVYYDTTRWIFYLILFGLFVHFRPCNTKTLDVSNTHRRIEFA